MNKISGEILASVFLALSMLFFSVSGVWAQSELLFGQNHFYTVIFRGNGESIAYARLVITNPDDKPLTEYSFEVPKATPTEMVIYQMKLPRNCIQYDYQKPTRPCLQYNDADYNQQYYYGGYGYGTAEFQKVQYSKSGNLYRFTLPTPIEPQKTTAVVVAYAAKGYVSKNLGLFKFNFETLKVPARIQQIRVAVDVDSDLLLKGKPSSVNYSSSGSLAKEFAAPSAVSSGQLDRVVRNIGAYGPLVKEAKNLSPNESFSVRGEYAAGWFALYFKSLVLSLLIIAAIFAAIYYLLKFFKKRDGGQIGQLRSETGGQTTAATPQKPFDMMILANAAVGLGSAVLIVCLTYFVRFLSETDMFRSVNYDIGFAIVGFITIILLYVLVVFGPAIAVAVKHGWKSLVLVLVAEFLWLVVFLVLYLSLFQSGLTSNFFGRKEIPVQIQSTPGLSPSAEPLYNESR